MSTDIGIIGPPASGVSILFEALTQGKASASAPQGIRIGVAKVGDKRLEQLSAMFNPQKTTAAEIRYHDISLAEGQGLQGLKLSGPILSQLGNLDVLVGVIPAFLFTESPGQGIESRLSGSLVSINQDLVLADLATIERRLERLNTTIQGKKAEERQQAQREYPLLQRLHSTLEEGVPLREIDLSPDDIGALSGYGLLSLKPLLAVVNLAEKQIPLLKSVESQLQDSYNSRRQRIIAVCAQIEKELAILDSESSQALREEFNLSEWGIDRVVGASYELLGLVTFFTVGPDEVKAWPIPGNTTALRAAGKIHSDIEKGFIRAEVVSFNDLMNCGSISEARRKGQLRLEGKDYIVQDGDIVHFLFNL